MVCGGQEVQQMSRDLKSLPQDQCVMVLQDAGLKAKPVPPDLAFTLKQMSQVSFQKLRIIKKSVSGLHINKQLIIVSALKNLFPL